MREEKWFLHKRDMDHKDIAQRYDLDPVTAILMINRGLREDQDIHRYLNGNLTDLYEPGLMKGMPDAISILKEKIIEGAPIRVIGDYDIDGIMSTYILTEGLGLLGAVVDHVIPHRIHDGYGLNEDIIRRAYEDGVDTIVTCDNGISAISQIELARSLGMTCIVTDHHDIPFREEDGVRTYMLPPAQALIDPKQKDCPYPFKGICGAVVALKLIQGLFEALEAHAGQALDLFLAPAAFATVGDVMELVDENRIIVKYGLRSLENTENIGLRELIRACELEGKTITGYHVGFILGPCMNAAGRLDTAEKALALLLAEDQEEARQLAQELKALNEERKDMTNEGLENAVELIESQDMLSRRVLVVYLPQVHESVAGIIAGRLREKYVRPVYVLTDSEEGLKGSGRSIPAYSMYDELVSCADIFSKFGGHPMAAGLSLPADRLEEFCQRIEDHCSLSMDQLYERVDIDLAMPFGYVTPALIESFGLLEPFGNGNSRPVFARKGLRLNSYRVMGRNRNVGKYTVVEEDGRSYELTYFGDQDELIDRWQTQGEMAVLYYPEINTYNGTSSIQFVIRGYK